MTSGLMDMEKAILGKSPFPFFWLLDNSGHRKSRVNMDGSKLEHGFPVTADPTQFSYSTLSLVAGKQLFVIKLAPHKRSLQSLILFSNKN